MKKTILILVLIFSLLVNAFGQQQGTPPAPAAPSTQQASAPAPQQDEEETDDVVRITTKLVQVDAVVVDREGKQVTDLKPEDFEILENGRPQVITNFSYVSSEPVAAPVAANANAAPPAPSPSPTASAPARVTAPKIPPVPLQAGQVRRAIALVVDDLRMSGESIAATRKALRKYVDEQVQTGDLVAIIRTSAGLGALQQFTSDRQQLYAAIERVRLLARSSTRIGAFTSVDTLDRLETQVTEPAMDTPPPGENIEARGGREGSTGQPSIGDINKARHEGLNEFRDSLFAAGTIGALNFVVRGLKDLPGRKAVVLFSDGIAIFNPNSQNRSERILTALRQLVDHASRASVVFYAIDTRGLQPTGLTAADNTSGSPQGPNGAGPAGPISGIAGIQTDRIGQQVLSPRSDELFEGQNGLNYLARETGGLALFNQNDLNKGIRRALDDLRGYYLIGYRPEDSTFDPTTGRRRFNTLTVKVKNRSDLRVRSRSGFLNVAEERAGERKRTRAEQLMAALLSPIPSHGVRLQLSSFFLNDARTGSTMRSVILMDARNLTFTKQPDGQQQTVVDIVAVTLSEDGQVIDRVSRIETIRARPSTVKRFLREGMVYGINVAIDKPGAYQVRVAVRDAATGRVGSASKYVEVPGVGKEQLALSSIVISGNNPAGMASRGESINDLISSILKSATPASTTPTAQTASVVAGGEGMIGAEDPQAGPASRRFRHGMFLNYACIIYNAKLDKAKRPQLTTQVRLFNAGQEVFTGAVVPLDLTDQTDITRPVVARRLQLGTILEPGDYVLHLTVTDELASGNQRTSARWIDFRID